MLAAGRGQTVASLMLKTGSNSTAPPPQHRLPTPPAPPPQTALQQHLLEEKIGIQESLHIILTTRIHLHYHLEATTTLRVPARQELRGSATLHSLVLVVIVEFQVNQDLQISQIMLGVVVAVEDPATSVSPLTTTVSTLMVMASTLMVMVSTLIVMVSTLKIMISTLEVMVLILKTLLMAQAHK